MPQNTAEPLGGVLRWARGDLIPVDELTAAALVGGWCPLPCVPDYPHRGTLTAAALTHAGLSEGLARPGFGMYLIRRRADALVVGDVGFHGPPEQGWAELGYGLAPSARGAGYATEAVRGLTEWALSQPGIERVVAETELSNTASQGVLRRAGFTRDGHAPAEPYEGVTLLRWVTTRSPQPPGSPRSVPR